VAPHPDDTGNDWWWVHGRPEAEGDRLARRTHARSPHPGAAEDRRRDTSDHRSTHATITPTDRSRTGRSRTGRSRTTARVPGNALLPGNIRVRANTLLPGNTRVPGSARFFGAD
jgi:hypothetical protein